MTEIILTSSVLILLLAVLRQALRGRISPCVQYALWLLAAARLLIPGTLFDAPVSVLGAAEGLQTSLHETFSGPDSLPEPVASGIITQLPRQESIPAVPPEAAYPDGDIAVSYQTVTPEAEIPQKVYNWPDIIWKTGIAVTGGALVLSNLIFALRLRRNRKRLALPTAPWSGKLPVYETEGLPSPCLFGLFRPAVYLNEAAMDTEHPEHILAHEYAHYRHGDHAWAVLRCVCLAVHWYNPLVWWAAALSRRDCELACDAAALRRLGEGDRIDYGHTLLKMVSKKRNPAALLQTATTMSAGKRAMKERIALIVRQPRMRKVTLVLVAALACLLAVCAFAGKAETQESQGPSEEREAPAAVYLTEMLSSQYRPGPVTDPEIVSRLWELYQGFEFDGATEEFTRDNVWSVTVTFVDGAGNRLAHFTIWAGGLCWLEDDYETFRVLRDGQAVYEEFRGCCRNAPRDESYTPNGTEVRDEALARLNALGGGKEAVYHFTGKTGAPANGTLTESELSALEEAFRACRWTKPAEHPADEYIVWDIRDSSFELMGDYPYWEKVTVGPFSFYDGHPYVLYDDGDTVDWYYVPEGWVTVQAALRFDTVKTLTLEEKKGLYLYEIARGEWHGFQYGWLYERAAGMFETEKGSWPSVGFFESIEDYRGYLQTMFSPEIAEYLLSMYTFQERDGRLHILQHGEGASNIYAGNEAVDVFIPSPEEAAQYGYSGHVFAQTPVLDRDLETVLGYKRHDFYYVWNGTHYVFTNFGPYDDVDPQIYYNAEEIIAQVQRGADVSEWLPLLNDMDWRAIAQAAVNAGMDGGDGTAAVTSIIAEITKYVDHNDGMTTAEYLYILSATEGLDGAATTRYAYMLYRMYDHTFAYVILSQLPEKQKNDVLDLVRSEWTFLREDSGDAPPSREEVIAQLESELEGILWASPGNMTLRSQGETFQFQLMNVPGIYALTYTSSDPDVAEVDDNGVVTAVAPGTATISLHCEGGGGVRDFTCAVRCDWDVDTAPAPEPAQQDDPPADIAQYNEMIMGWQQAFFGFVFEIPAMPDQELAYDSQVENGLEQAVLSTLAEYYQSYVAEHGNSAHNDRFSRIILESEIPEFAEYKERITVAYQVECQNEREWNGVTYPLTPQAGEHLSTTFTVYQLGGMLTAGPPMPHNASYTCTLTPGTASGEDNWNLDYIRRDIQARTENRMQSDSDLSQWSVTSVEFAAGHGSLPENIVPGNTAEVQYELHVTYSGALGYSTVIGPLSVVYTFSE